MRTRIYYQDPNVTLYHGDCRDVLPTLGKVDAVVTDPPYGIGGYVSSPSKWRRRRGSNGEAWDNSTPQLCDEIFDVPVVAIWGGNHFELPPSRGWLVWSKPDAPPSMADVELCWTNQDAIARRFTYSIGQTNAERVDHPTQKPLALMEWVLETLKCGNTILDPFLGSGTTAVACIRTGRKCIGIEIEEKYCEIAVRRIRRAYDDMALLTPPPKAITTPPFSFARDENEGSLKR